jgi:hypothetical protein
VRRNKRKMGGFASWEIFGTGFKIVIFAVFPRQTGFKILVFSAVGDFSAVSWDFEGWARPKILCGFSHNEQGKIWIFPRCPAIFWEPKKFSKCGFPRGFLGFQRMGSSKYFWNSNFPAVFLGF